MTKKWLETRRSYLEKLKKQVQLSSGEEDPAIKNYAQENEDLYQKVWDESSEDAFFKALENKKVVLCGDFHSSPSVKRFYRKMLKRRVGDLKNRPILFALECFYTKDQPYLEMWLKGVLSDSKFLEMVEWEKNWGFHWEPYKKLIYFLHRNGVQLFCVNSPKKDIRERDQEIAQRLKDILQELESEQQDARTELDIKIKEPLLFCLIGQHHLGPRNLKDSLKKIDSCLDPLCLHLDAEELYFLIADINFLEHLHVLACGDHFCFLNSPPWVHWQSYILFLEHFLNQEEEYYSEFRGVTDYEEVVLDYVKLMCRDLDIAESSVLPVEVATIDEYQVEGEEHMPSELHKIMQPLLDSETSFYWPEQSEAIMVVNSLNHAASVAGRYLHASMMKVDHYPWGKTDSFKVWSWLEAISYFLSKLINPKRAPLAAQNLSAFLAARLGMESSKKIMTLLIQQRVQGGAAVSSTPKAVPAKDLSWSELIYASRLKGSLLGEAIFELYLSGELSAETIKTYMSLSVNDKKYFEPLYDFVVERSKFVDID